MHRAPWLAAAAAAVLALAPASARADVLRLGNGRTMHGTVDRGYLDEDYLRVQLFATGGVVRVRWDHLIPEDRDRWQVDLGLKVSDEAESLKVDGHKVLFVNADTRFGLVLNPEAMDGPSSTMVRIQSAGKVEEYPRGQVTKIEPTRLELPQVFTPEQAYERKRDEMNPVTGYDHFDLAEYARKVGAYDRAKEHYERAREDADFASTPLGRSVESRLAVVDLLLRHKALKLELDEINRTLVLARADRSFESAAKKFLRAREAIFDVMQRVEDKKIQKEFQIPELAVRVEADRRAFFQRYLPGEVYNRLRTLLYRKAQEEKVKDIPPGVSRAERAQLMIKGTFEGARQYATRQVVEELWTGIMQDVGASEWIEQINATMEKDPSRLTDAEKERAKRLATMEKDLKAELLRFWENRNRNLHRTTSYGYGSFLVVKSDFKLGKPSAPSGGTGGNRGGRQGGGGGAASQQQPDKPKTPEEWWEAINTKDRTDWLQSWCAERGQLLEVIRAWDEPHSDCAGLGYLKSSVASTGEVEYRLDPVCNGSGKVRKVKWR